MEHVVIPACLRLVRWQNDGAAFSIARGQTSVLLAISAVALVLVVAIFLFAKIHNRLMQVSLALFTAGITGNLYDRAFNNGLVRDFIDVYVGDHHWPAFNVADSMLCVAVGLLLITSFRAEALTSASSQKHAGEQK
jgi:signal peptidase II